MDGNAHAVFFLPPPNGECYLFVCVSVNNIAEKLVNGFSWNFQDRSGMIHKQFGTFGSNPLGTGFSLLCFQIRAYWQHYGKTDELIFMKFPTKVRQAMICIVFWMLRLTPWIQGRFLLFHGSVFVMEKRENGFSWNFHEMAGTSQEIIV